MRIQEEDEANAATPMDEYRAFITHCAPLHGDDKEDNRQIYIWKVIFCFVLFF